MTVAEDLLKIVQEEDTVGLRNFIKENVSLFIYYIYSNFICCSEYLPLLSFLNQQPSLL